MTHASGKPHRVLAALSLFLLSPLIGEWLLGNQPVTELPAVLVLAPLYGGGAVLVRETARRAGRGWPTMVLLAAAYALVEEGPVDQMLWNSHYSGVDMGGAYAATRVPLLGTSVAMVQDVLAVHTIWSICVPIALVEAFTRDRTRPWLKRPGLALTGVVFVGGSLLLALVQVHSEQFVASPAQFALCGSVIVALIAVALALPRRRPASGGEDAPVPRPLLLGAGAFASTSLYMARDLVPGGFADWAGVGYWCVAAVAGPALVLRWSRRTGWGARHRLALAGGALLTYVWAGFAQARTLDIPHRTALLGNVLFGTAALLLLAAAVHTVRRRERAGTEGHPQGSLQYAQR